MVKGKEKGVALNVRGVPAEVVEALEASALTNDRTREGEARAALRAWVAPEPRSSATDYIGQVGSRLSYALDQAKEQKGFRNLSPSRLAELVGESRASHVVAAFHGETELPLAVVDSLADSLGVSREWLKHGDGVPYPIEQELRLDADTEGVVNFLLGDGKVDLRLLRTDDKAGGLYIVRHHRGSLRCDVFSTLLHVSDEIAAGGERMLRDFFKILERIYQAYTTIGSETMVKSYLIDADLAYSEARGVIHPLTLVDQARELPWWEDLWDANATTEHWPGMLELKRRIIASMR